jgi:hypothetical protein
LIETSHPAQVADEDAEVDGVGRLSYCLALFFDFMSHDFSFSMLLPNLSVSALPFISFCLLSLLFYLQ